MKSGWVSTILLGSRTIRYFRLEGFGLFNSKTLQLATLTSRMMIQEKDWVQHPRLLLYLPFVQRLINIWRDISRDLIRCIPISHLWLVKVTQWVWFHGVLHNIPDLNDAWEVIQGAVDWEAFHAGVAYGKKKVSLWWRLQVMGRRHHHWGSLFVKEICSLIDFLIQNPRKVVVVVSRVAFRLRGKDRSISCYILHYAKVFRVLMSWRRVKNARYLLIGTYRLKSMLYLRK